MQLAAVFALLVVAAVDARIGDDPSLGVRICPSSDPDVVTCRRNALQSALSLLAGGEYRRNEDDSHSIREETIKDKTLTTRRNSDEWATIRPSGNNYYHGTKQTCRGWKDKDKTGIPSIGARPIDPLTQIPPLILHAESPFKLKFKLDDIVMIGHSRSVLDNLEIDVQNHTVHVVTHTPGALIIKGIYTLDEEVIKGIPMRGNGRFKLTMIDSTADVTYKGHPVTGRGGETFLKLDSAKTKYTYGKTNYELTGLFGGFAPLEAAGNALINRMASPIVEREMLGPMEDWMEQVYKEQAQYVFDTIPYNKLFPESVNTIPDSVKSLPKESSFFYNLK